MSNKDDLEKLDKSEKPTEAVVETPTRKQAPAWLPWVLGGAGIVVLLLVSYTVGAQVGKRQTVYGQFNDNGQTRNMPGGMMGGGYGGNDQRVGGTRSGMMGTGGQVTAISSDSITLTDTTRGGSVTYKINSSTTVTDASGNTKAISDIKSGNTVRIQAQSSDTSFAGTIRITNA
jgi:hypothetical protein